MGAFLSMQENLIKGALLILLSELFLVLSGTVIKQIATELPTESIVFFRNLLGLVILLPLLMRVGVQGIKTDLLRFHFMRAAVGVTAMSCLYYSWAHLPLAMAALLKQTAPFFIPLIGYFWLSERLGVRTLLAIFVGFIGVYAVLNPQEGSLNMAVLIAIFGAALGGLAKVTIRRMSGSESPQRIVFYFALFSTVLAAIPALRVWVTPDLTQLMWLALLAGTSTLAQLLLSQGYSFAPAGQLGAFTYGSVVFAALLGWWLFAETPALHTWIGIVLISSAGIFAIRARGR